MNQKEADQDVADEVSEEVDSKGEVMRSEKNALFDPCPTLLQTRFRITTVELNWLSLAIKKYSAAAEHQL